MSFQTSNFSLATNEVNFIEGRRNAIEANTSQLAHYAYFGEAPRFNGANTIVSDWLVYGPPVLADAQGTKVQSDVQASTSVAESPQNHFTDKVVQSTVDRRPRAGINGSAALGVGNDDLQIRRNINKMMIGINALYGSNLESVKEDSTNKGRAGNPVTFYTQYIDIGSGSAGTAPAGYDAADTETSYVVDNTATRKALTLAHIQDAVASLAGQMSAQYVNASRGFVAVVPNYTVDNITASSAPSGIGSLNRVNMTSTSMGTYDGVGAALEIDLSLVCVNTNYGKCYIIPSLKGHQLADTAGDRATGATRSAKAIAYVCRPEFTQVVYADDWEEEVLHRNPTVREVAVKAMYSFIAPSKDTGVVIRGLLES